MQSIDSTYIDSYAYGASHDLVKEKEEIKCNNIIKQYKLYFDDVTKEKIKEHNPNCPQIPDHPYRVLIIEGSGSGKTNLLFNLISHQPDIDKSFLYTINPFEATYQFLLTNKKVQNDSKACIEYLADMDDIYKNIERYNPNKKRKVLIAFDDMLISLIIKNLIQY